MATTTFLFVDQVGSTEQLSRLGDAVAQQVRRSLFDLLRQSTEAHGGREVDFTGDGLFCAFDSAADAVDAAVAMQQVVSAGNDRRPADHAATVRIGLHTGEPLQSEGGGYFGAAVVVAARLCGHAGGGQILASALVRALVGPRGLHRFEPLGQVPLRGIPEPVEVWSVGWDRDDRPGRLPAALAAARRGPFVGRARELAAVLAAGRRIADGGRVLVLLSGDSGMGVTRLTAEAAELLRRTGATVWAGTGQGPGARLAAWAEAVEEWAGAVTRAELRQAAGDRAGDLARLVPALVQLLPGLSPPPPTDPEVATFLVADAVDAVAERISAEVPLVVVLDRLHLADPASLTALRRLLCSRRGGQILAIGGYEPAAAGARRVLGALADVPGMVDLRLSGLSGDEVRDLVGAVVGEPATDSAVRAVLAESEGSPFYVLQMARSMRQQGITQHIEEAVGRAVELRSDLRLQREEIALGLRQLDELRDETADPESLRIEPDGTPPAPGTSPYRGLLAFASEDAEVFFGREALVAEMVAALTVSRWLAVVGPSGSGKSSAVRAGLQPALGRGALADSAGWVVVDVRPGGRPLEALGAVLGERSGRLDGPAVAARLAAEPLGRVAADLFGSRRLVLHVDQFEELWTSAPEDARARTVDLLVDAATSADESVSVVVTMRADYYGRTAEHPALATLMAGSQVLVPPMTTAELRAAVEQPARQAGLVLEPGLAQAVVDEVAREPGALPLLSTAMQETWERRRGRSLTLTGYAETGGARRAIATLADATFDELDPRQQEIARRLLLRLAAPAADGGDVARPAPLSELLVDEDAQVVLDRLAARRLVTAGATTAQVAHEALLREWPRLRAWLDADREGRRLHQQIAAAVTEWEATGRDDDALLRGARLAAATDWRAEHEDQLSARERALIDASVERRDRDVQHARRATRRLQVLAAALVVLLAGAGVATVVAVDNSRTADQRATEAVARDLVNQSASLTDDRLDTALLLAVEAYRRHPSPETEAGLLGALDGAYHLTGFRHELPEGAVPSATSSDGRTLWVLTRDGELLAFDTTDWTTPPTEVVSGLTGAYSLDVSPDGRRAVYVAEDGPHLMDLDGGSFPSPALIADAAGSAEFSPDGQYAVFASELRGVAVLDARSGAVVHEFPAGDFPSALVRPGRNEVVLSRQPNGSPAVLQRLGLDGLALGDPVELNSWSILDWDYARDGSLLVVATGEGAVQVLDPDTLLPVGRQIAAGGPANPVPLVVAPGPRLELLAIGYDDGSVGVAHVSSPDGAVELFRTTALPGGFATPHWLDEHRVLAVTESSAAELDLRRPTRLGEALDAPAADLFVAGLTALPDQRGLLYVADARLGSIDAARDPGPLDVALPLDPAGQVFLAVSLDGAWAAVAGPVPGAGVWEPGAEEPGWTLIVLSLRTGDPAFRTDVPWLARRAQLAFSPDSRTLAYVSGEGRVAQIDVPSGRPRGDPKEVGAWVDALHYSPDGAVLLAVGDEGRAWPIDVATGDLGDPSVLTPTGAPVTDLALTPDHTRLVVTTGDGQVVFADPRTGRPTEAPLRAGSSYLGGAAVSPDGSSLVAVDGGGALHLWDLESGREFPGLRARANVDAPVFLRGSLVLADSWDGGLQALDLDPDIWRATACEVAGRDLSRQEWAAYLPGEPYRQTCSPD